MYTQNFIKPIAALHELLCLQRKRKKLSDNDENYTAGASAGSRYDKTVPHHQSLAL